MLSSHNHFHEEINATVSAWWRILNFNESEEILLTTLNSFSLSMNHCSWSLQSKIFFYSMWLWNVLKYLLIKRIFLFFNQWLNTFLSLYLLYNESLCKWRLYFFLKVISLLLEKTRKKPKKNCLHLVLNVNCSCRESTRKN